MVTVSTRAGWSADAGFTLLEAVVALTLSGLIVLLVTASFVAQNDYYAYIMDRQVVQETARSVVEYVATELRGVTADGFTAAESDRLVVRQPVGLGAVCGAQAADSYVHLTLDVAELDTDEVAGYAIRDEGGSWAYTAASWSSISAGSGDAAAACADRGADTAGVAEEYRSLRLTDPPPDPGTVVLFFRELELEIGDSELMPGTRALFASVAGGGSMELGTGLTGEAGFRYLLDGSYLSTVSGADLADIKGVRLMVEAESAREQPPFAYALTLDVPLTNAR